MSAKAVVPVKIKIKEEFDQILVEEQQAVSAQIHNADDEPFQMECLKRYTIQMDYEEPVADAILPPSEAGYGEERVYSLTSERWKESTLTYSERESHTEDESAVEMDYNGQAQVEVDGMAEDLCSIDHQRTLGEILTYCQVMYDAIRKLDEKFDHLQARVSSIQAVDLSPDGFQQETNILHQMDVSMPLDSALPMPQLVRVCSPPPPFSECKKPPKLSPAPEEQSPTRQSSRVGRLATRPIRLKKSGQKATAPAKVSVTRSWKKKSSSAVRGAHKTAWLGDPGRKIEVLSSILQKAGNLEKPQSAVRFLLRNLFPMEILTSSSITGDTGRGLKKLDPNRIAAIREWVAEQFPNFDLRESSKEWKGCISIMNSTARYLRFEAKKHKRKEQIKSGRKAPSKQDNPTTQAAKTTAEIDVELSDSEGTTVKVSRRSAASSIQQRAPESSHCPAAGSRDATGGDAFEYLGPPSRKVKVPQCAMVTARQRTRPELVARFLVKYMFPEDVLVRSNVYGNRDRGIQPLDRNKISALREHLKEQFPWLLLDENGQDWKACVGAINSTLRKFRHELKKGKILKKAR